MLKCAHRREKAKPAYTGGSLPSFAVSGFPNQRAANNPCPSVDSHSGRMLGAAGGSCFVEAGMVGCPYHDGVGGTHRNYRGLSVSSDGP